jgi:hypothetical protein
MDKNIVCFLSLYIIFVKLILKKEIRIFGRYQSSQISGEDEQCI